MRNIAVRLRGVAGLTLLEVLSTLAITSLVTGSLFLLIGTSVRGRLITHARISDQERGRQALAWLADRLRQVNYDSSRACRDGFIRIGTGNGFTQRLAFRAIVDQTMSPQRRTFAYWVENRTLWENVLDECADDSVQGTPIALTPPIVEPPVAPANAYFVYLRRDGAQITNPADSIFVQSLTVVMPVSAPSAIGRPPEMQIYRTVVALRGP